MMLLGKRRGLSLSILCLLTELFILAHAQGDNSNTTSTVAATPAATTTLLRPPRLLQRPHCLKLPFPSTFQSFLALPLVPLTRPESRFI